MPSIQLQSPPINAWSQFIPCKPTPKQAAFLLLPCREVLYGGAAGGAKSYALLMAALQFVDRPGYAALILRRTYPELSKPGALLDVARNWLSGTAATWKDSEKCWLFPSGATLSFGYLQTDSDKYQYQSAAFQFIGFDELTEFTESQYRFLFSRLRRIEGSDIPIRMRAASNPGNIGHDWVKQRFMIEPNSERIFLPAKLSDNPHLDRAEYEKTLAELDPITRRQLLDGDWSARQAGGMFRREWFDIVEEPPASMRRVRFWDFAATEQKPGKDPDYTVGCLMGVSNGTFYVCDIRRGRLSPGAGDALMLQTAQLDGRTVPIYEEQEPGSAGVRVIDAHRRMLVGYNYHGEPSTGNKATRAAPMSSQAEGGNVKLVRGPWINAFLDEIEVFPLGSHDDQVDAASGAFGYLAVKRMVAYA